MQQSVDPQKTAHISPKRASYGVAFMMIWQKTDHGITTPHCMSFSQSLKIEFTDNEKYVEKVFF